MARNFTGLSRLEKDVAIGMRAWKRKVDRARRRYSFVIDAACVDDEGNYPKEWEQQPYFKERLRVALDARKSKRNVPAYIEHLGRLVEGADRMAATQQTAVQLNIGAVNIVQAPRYEELEVGPPVIDAVVVPK
jgi:hypothetical protein